MSFHGKLAYYKFQLQMKVCSFAEPKMQTSVAVGMDNASRSSGGTEITNTSIVIHWKVIFPADGVINPLNNRSHPYGMGCARTSIMSECVHFSALLK